jgi:RNA recognition motif-containing protein
VVEKGEKMRKKLYVGNLSYKVTEEDLKDLFKEFETVTEVNVITDRATGRSRGFGFVEFSSGDDADKAIESLNGKMFQDREIAVNEARPRKKREFREGGDKAWKRRA